MADPPTMEEMRHAVSKLKSGKVGGSSGILPEMLRGSCCDDDFRLQELAEEVLPESQCGFRKGRGCSDMIFTVRQLIEKANEHKAKIFLVFIYLRKAYDSVPREALWVALGKLGVPDSVIEWIRSFHQGMKAAIRLDNTMLEEINVENRVRQGCCMAPVLFNLYASMVAERWSARMKNVRMCMCLCLRACVRACVRA